MKTKLLNKWKIMQLREVGEIVTGNTPSKMESNNYGNDIIWIKPPDLDKEKYVNNSSEKISAKARNLVRLVPKGAVLVSCIGNIGKVSIANCELCTNQQINSIVPKKDIINSEFLYFTIKKMRAFLENQGSSAVIPLLNKSEFSKIKIHVPAISTQKAIVSILEKAEKVKEVRKEADELTDNFLNSVFIEMFGNCDKYPIRELKELVKEFKFGSSTKSGSEGYSILGIPNVLGEELELKNCNNVNLSQKEFENFKLKKDDILFVRTNGNPSYIGRCGVFQLKNNDKYVFASYLIRTRVKSDLLDPLFLKTYLELPRGRKDMLSKCRTTAGQYNINTQGLGSLKIPLVPIKLQKKFVSFFHQIIHLKDHQKQSEEHVDNFFNVSMQKAFKGELVC